MIDYKQTGSSLRSIQLIWNGFTYKWKQAPHRLSILGSRFSDLQLENDALRAKHDQYLKIGNWPPDSATFQSPYLTVEAENVFIGAGQTDGLILSEKLGKECEREFTVQVDPAALHSTFDTNKINRDTFGKLKVLINGFKIQAENNRSGWHFRGLCVDVKDATWADEKNISFKVTLLTHPDRNPDPLGHGNRGPNGERWRADQPCIYKLTLDYVLVMGTETSMDMEEIEITHSVVRKKHTHHAEKVSFPNDFNKFPSAFAGISGFGLRLDNEKLITSTAGRYIKEMAVYISELAPNLKESTLDCTGNLAFSNGGFVTYSWNLAAHMRIAKIGVGSGARIRSHEIQGATNGDGVVTSSQIEAKLVGEAKQA